MVTLYICTNYFDILTKNRYSSHVPYAASYFTYSSKAYIKAGTCTDIFLDGAPSKFARRAHKNFIALHLDFVAYYAVKVERNKIYPRLNGAL